MGKLRDYIPALKYGHKILPSDLAGMVGLPQVGNIWYVDPNGSDSAGGQSQEDAFATVTQAVSSMTADQDDVVILAGTSSTGRTTETAGVAWSKRRTHLVGNGPARSINNRNGVSFAALGSGSCFTISATNCSFSNLSFASFTDNNVLVEVTADYQTFDNIHFQGMGIQAAADDTAGRSLLFTGAGEIEVRNSTIGIDTVTRGAANASFEATGSCARNKFISCYFPAYTDSADVLFVKADTGNCTERFLLFSDCLFNNATLGSSTTMTIAMDLSATGNGTVILKDSYQIGCTDWTNTFTNLYSAGIPTVPTQATAGFMQVLA